MDESLTEYSASLGPLRYDICSAESCWKEESDQTFTLPVVYKSCTGTKTALSTSLHNVMSSTLQDTVIKFKVNQFASSLMSQSYCVCFKDINDVAQCSGQMNLWINRGGCV